MTLPILIGVALICVGAILILWYVYLVHFKRHKSCSECKITITEENACPVVTDLCARCYAALMMGDIRMKDKS